jgi:hypothetical protein
MTNITKAIIETYTNDQELYMRSSNTTGKSDGWRQVDTLRFMRQMKLQQEIRFAEYWLPRQETRLDSQRNWVKHWLERRNGDEISELNYQASKAQAQAEHHTVMFLQSQLDDARRAYSSEFEEEWTSHTGNVAPIPEQPQELSAMEKAELKALGIDC